MQPWQLRSHVSSVMQPSQPYRPMLKLRIGGVRLRSMKNTAARGEQEGAWEAPGSSQPWGTQRAARGWVCRREERR